MAAISALKNNDELLKKLQEQQKIGMPQTQVNPEQTQDGRGSVGSADAFNQKYNVQSLFQVKPDSNVGGATQRFNNMQSFAGTSGGSQVTNDVTNNPMSMTGSVWVSATSDAPPANIINGPSNVQGTGPNTNTGVHQPSQNEGNQKEGSLGDGDKGNDKPKFSAGDIFAMTGGLTVTSSSTQGLGGTETVSDIGGDNNPKSTGDATFSTKGEVDQSAKSDENNPIDNENNNNSTNGTENNGNVNGSGNDVNKHDSANGNENDNSDNIGDNGAGNNDKEINKQEEQKIQQEQDKKEEEIKLKQQEDDEAA